MSRDDDSPTRSQLALTDQRRSPTDSDLGTPASQANRVARALVLLIGAAVIAGCLSPPSGVACERHPACNATCPGCVDVPGCGPICIPRDEACRNSCPIPFECNLSEQRPAVLRCDGLVPGRRVIAHALAPVHDE